MFDHVGLNVRDYEASKRFYEQALALARLRRRDGVPDEWKAAGSGRRASRSSGSRSASRSAPATHVAFAAPDRATVDAFHAAALAAGGTDNGAAGHPRARTTRPTTARSSSTPTATTSRPSATGPLPRLRRVPWDPLTDEQRELRDLVRTLARERIAPRAAEIDESHEFPWDVVELFREHGHLRPALRRGVGRHGHRHAARAVAIEEVSKVCATSGLILAVQELGSLGLKLAGTAGAEGALAAAARVGRVARAPTR